VAPGSGLRPDLGWERRYQLKPGQRTTRRKEIPSLQWHRNQGASRTGRRQGKKRKKKAHVQSPVNQRQDLRTPSAQGGERKTTTGHHPPSKEAGERQDPTLRRNREEVRAVRGDLSKSAVFNGKKHIEPKQGVHRGQTARGHWENTGNG